MNNWIRILPLALLMPSAVAAQMPTKVPNGLPSWSYNIPDKDQPPTVEQTGPVTVPGSSKSLDHAQVTSAANPPDWFPEEHPPAPRIVKDESGKAKTACGTCHLMSGQGHPESADIAGLPVEYFIRQMAYFKSWSPEGRRSHGPDCESRFR